MRTKRTPGTMAGCLLSEDSRELRLARWEQAVEVVSGRDQRPRGLKGLDGI
jgi:hypothetical protein